MMMAQNRPNPIFKVEHRGNGHREKLKGIKLRKWSHQNELEEMIGKEIVVTFNNLMYNHIEDIGQSYADHVYGMLINADAYTVQIAHPDKSVMTYFKHSIRCYTLKNAPANA